ncbi:MAG: hypothetical protein LBR47_02395, partial [Spirochaetaceae bacterium]|nr:hypothetical protein [Spirochaetaceae bacterium]
MCSAKYAYRYRSITWKLLIPMLLVLVIQAFFFTSVILLGGIVRYLEENSCDILMERVSSRRNNIQNEMTYRWSNLTIAELRVNNAVAEFLAQKGIDLETLLSSRTLAAELLETISSHIIFMMRTASTTGGFIVLNDNGLFPDEADAKIGLYFRDMDPLSTPSDNSDILVERSPVSIIGSLKIPTGTNWTNRFFLKGEDSEPAGFFYKPLLEG